MRRPVGRGSSATWRRDTCGIGEAHVARRALPDEGPERAAEDQGAPPGVGAGPDRQHVGAHFLRAACSGEGGCGFVGARHGRRASQNVKPIWPRRLERGLRRRRFRPEQEERRGDGQRPRRRRARRRPRGTHRGLRRYWFGGQPAAQPNVARWRCPSRRRRRRRRRPRPRARRRRSRRRASRATGSLRRARRARAEHARRRRGASHPRGRRRSRRARGRRSRRRTDGGPGSTGMARPSSALDASAPSIVARVATTSRPCASRTARVTEGSSLRRTQPALALLDDGGVAGPLSAGDEARASLEQLAGALGLLPVDRGGEARVVGGAGRRGAALDADSATRAAIVHRVFGTPGETG